MTRIEDERAVEIGARVLAHQQGRSWEGFPGMHKWWLDTMRAALAAFEEAGLVVEQGWQPIETAPKDGTPVDLWAYDQTHGQWGRRPHCAWERMADWDGSEYEGWAGLQRGTWWSCEWVSPSHWRPLPAPPAVKADPQ